MRNCRSGRAEGIATGAEGSCELELPIVDLGVRSTPFSWRLRRGIGNIRDLLGECFRRIELDKVGQ